MSEAREFQDGDIVWYEIRQYNLNYKLINTLTRKVSETEKTLLNKMAQGQVTTGRWEKLASWREFQDEDIVW